ncbi:MAG: dihydroorotase [Hyphomonadaceae bacterium]|nr:MAG: dihydroorotase [Hyphomonadaceae bacterium]
MAAMMNNMKIFTNARVIDPASDFDGKTQVLVNEGVIVGIGDELTEEYQCEIIDCDGHVLMPGLIDMRVSTGEPGEEHRETLRSAGYAAVSGGITTIVVQPDTNPCIDDASKVDFIKRRGRDYCLAKVLPCGALTKGLAGEQMAEIGLMAQAGAIMFANGYGAIKDTKVMQRLLAYSCTFDALIAARPQDPWLAKGGVVAQGELAARLGLGGISSSAETIFANRDISLAAATGAKLLLDMVSSKNTIPLIETAKGHGLDVFASVNIHNLCLNDNDIGDYRTFAKLDPPLRSESDRLALIKAIKDGIIDVIVSGHDPRPPEEKRLPFDEAAFGSSALEALLPAALTLYHAGNLELLEIIKPLTANPAAILGLAQGKIQIGAPADLIVVDLGYPHRFDASQTFSKSKNAAFDGRLFQGKVLQTFVNGAKLYDIETGVVR